MFALRLLLATLALGAGAVKLGEPAPDFRITGEKGTATALADFRGKKEVALLFGGDVPDPGSLIARLERLEAALIHVNSRNDPEGAVRRKFLGQERATVAVLIDRKGRVRRVERAGAAEDVVAMLERWRLGKSNYTTVCKQCHGEDGATEPGSAVPALHGIGNRMTDQEIRGRIYAAPAGADLYFVRGYWVTERDLDAVAAYVAGL